MIFIDIRKEGPFHLIKITITLHNEVEQDPTLQRSYNDSVQFLKYPLVEFSPASCFQAFTFLIFRNKHMFSLGVGTHGRTALFPQCFFSVCHEAGNCVRQVMEASRWLEGKATEQITFYVFGILASFLFVYFNICALFLSTILSHILDA